MSTPEQKAKELIQRFWHIIPEAGRSVVAPITWDIDWKFDESGHKEACKACALICVEQAILYHPLPNEPDERSIKFHDFWNKVKEEIEKYNP